MAFLKHCLKIYFYTCRPACRIPCPGGPSRLLFCRPYTSALDAVPDTHVFKVWCMMMRFKYKSRNLFTKSFSLQKTHQKQESYYLHLRRSEKRPKMGNKIEFLWLKIPVFMGKFSHWFTVNWRQESIYYNYFQFSIYTKTQLCKNISSIENPTAPIKNSTLKKDVIYYSN